MNNYKITPQVHKQIIETAKTMPAFQKYTKNHKPLFRVLTRVVKGVDLPEENRPKDFSITKTYIQKYSEPILFNHEVELIEVYRKNGQKGVDGYVKYFMDKFNESESKNDRNDKV